MTALRRALRRLMHRLRRGSGSADLDEEFAFHLDAETRYNVSKGMDPREARQAAIAAFGRSDRYREAVRDIGRVPVVEPMLREGRLALTTLRRRPIQTVASLVTLGLGVGAGAFVLSMLRGVTDSTLPVPEPQEIVLLDRWTDEVGPERSLRLPAHDVAEHQRTLLSVESVGAAAQGSFVLGDVQRAGRVVGAAMTPEMFDVASRAPALGRVIGPDDVSASPRPVVISWRVWQDRLAADPAVLDRQILVDGARARIIGVMPEGFVFPVSAEIWVPLDLPALLATPRAQAPTLMTMARMAEGRIVEDVMADLSGSRASSADRAADEELGYRERARVYTAAVWSGDDFVQTFRILWILAASFLAVAILNVANLRLASFMGRGPELSVRRSLGAGRGTLVRLLVLESLVLATAGGAFGLALAVLGLEWIAQKVAVLDLPTWISFAPDLGTTLFTIGIVVVALPITGVVPALRATARPDLGRGTTGRIGWGVRALVGGQVGVSVALLFSAAIAARSLTDFSDRPLGFDVADVATARTLLPPRVYASVLERTTFLDRLEAEGGGATLALASGLPPEGAGRVPYRVEGDATEGVPRTVQRVVASSGYFDVLGVPVESGRGLRPSDDGSSPIVAIVNRAFVNDVWGEAESGIGRFVEIGQVGSGTRVEVVGVVPDLQHTPFDFTKFPTLYLSWRQFPSSNVALLVASDDLGDPRALVAGVDPELAVWDERSLAGVVAEARLAGGVVASLFASLATLATLLASVGLFAVMSFWSASRAREVGVRLALGATPTQVGRWIAARGGMLALPGFLFGTLLAFGISRLFAAAFPEIDAFPLLDFISVMAVLAASAIAALAVPSLRAARTEATSVLRGEGG